MRQRSPLDNVPPLRLTRYAKEFPEAGHELVKVLRRVERYIRKELSEMTEHEMSSRLFEQAPVALGQKPLEGISAHWNFPAGVDPHDIEIARGRRPMGELARELERHPPLSPPTSAAVIQILTKMWAEDLPLANRQLDTLIELNPAIKGINVRRTDGEALNQVIIGLASQYTVSDINHFLVGGNATLSAEHRQKRQLIIEHLGPVQWAPSADTIDKIWRQTELAKTVHLSPSRPERKTSDKPLVLRLRS